MSASRETLRIVMVENDEDDAFFLKRAIEQAGFIHPMIRLKDGAEAIDYFKGLEVPTSRLPDIVLTDLKMPRFDGIDLVRWLRAHPTLKDLPVIVLTSSNDLSERRRTARLGIYKFLTKQVRYENVVSALELFLLSINDSGDP